MKRIIAFEGQVLAGKSTLAREVARRLGWDYVCEYADLARMPETPCRSVDAATIAIKTLSDLEARRKRMIGECANARGLVVDRIYLSRLACDYAHKRLSLPGRWEYACGIVQTERAGRVCIEPDLLVYLGCGHDEARRREAMRSPMIPFFMREDVYALQDEFYRVVLAASDAPRVLKLVCGGNMLANVEEILSFIESRAHLVGSFLPSVVDLFEST